MFGQKQMFSSLGERERKGQGEGRVRVRLGFGWVRNKSPIRWFSILCTAGETQRSRGVNKPAFFSFGFTPFRF